MRPRRILLVCKVPLAERLPGGTIARLDSSGAMSRNRMQASADRQRESLALVHAALAGHEVHERRVHELRPTDADDADLVVTVGGDGTVFTANTLSTQAPFLTVNSDPQRSLGHYTRTRDTEVARLFQSWLAGTCSYQDLPRLRIRTATVDVRVLNDALFTNRNPAAMSRYLLDDGHHAEKQRSSGVWVSTGAGSTGGIHSAGMTPVPPLVPALLWKVREPFHSFGRLHQLSGVQSPPGLLRLTPALPGMAVYLDGPNITVGLEAGDQVEITAADQPLRLVIP